MFRGSAGLKPPMVGAGFSSHTSAHQGRCPQWDLARVSEHIQRQCKEKAPEALKAEFWLEEPLGFAHRLCPSRLCLPYSVTTRRSSRAPPEVHVGGRGEIARYEGMWIQRFVSVNSLKSPASYASHGTQ